MSRQRYRPLNAHITVDVIELCEAAEKVEARGRDGVAHGGYVRAIGEVVNRIAIEKSHCFAVNDRRRIDESGAPELADRSLDHILIRHLPYAIAPFVRGDLSHHRRRSRSE